MPPIEGEKNTVEELAKQLPNVAAYGMLLLDDRKHPISRLVRERCPEMFFTSTRRRVSNLTRFAGE
jgi:hypothetical protein